MKEERIIMRVMRKTFPLGKLPVEFLGPLLAKAPISDPRVVQGPGTGLDCAVVDLGDRLMVIKSDPITFATEEIGWYAVQVNANDIATTGAEPRWLMATLLLPEHHTTPVLVQEIFDQLSRACQGLGISLVGGHSEVTSGLDRPILAVTLIGEVSRENLVSPHGACTGDHILLTKGVPLEGTALLAREFSTWLSEVMTRAELEEARAYLTQPGISVVRDAHIALRSGRVTAMHDPTEGGLLGALWELSDASGKRLRFDPQSVPIPPLAGKVCRAFGINPLATIASGALLLTCPPGDAGPIQTAMWKEGISCTTIGGVEEGPAGVFTPEGKPVIRPSRDEITRVFEGK